MGDPRYRATEGALAFDAYYSDEFGCVNDDQNTIVDVDARKGFHKSRFTSVFARGGRQVEQSATSTFTFDNQANPNENTSLIVKQRGCPPKGQDKRHATIYFANSVMTYWQSILAAKAKWATPINLTVLFAVRTQMNRCGLRSFFEAQTNMQGLVVISGVEAPRDNPVQIGVSPSTAVLKVELAKLFGMDVTFRIRVLAAFSTGYCGLNSCLQNELLDLFEVERLVFYDCLYLAGADVSTIAAVQKLRSKVDKGKFKLLAYKCTRGGNNMADAAAVKLHPQLVALFSGGPHGLIENLCYARAYALLVTHRILSTAFEDHVVAFPSESFKKAFEDLKAGMPKRGYMISNLDAYRYVFGASVDISKRTVFADWARSNTQALRQFWKFLGTSRDANSIRGLIWQNRLPGWIIVAPDGEENHDLLLSEFGWEYLPY